MKMDIINILSATLGTMGFSLLFNMKKDKILVAGLSGMISWTSYLIIYEVSKSNLIASMAATIVVCIWSEFLARKLKAPANIFLLPAIFPLIPGSSIYYFMDGFIKGDSIKASTFGMATIESTTGIVVGIVLGTSFFYRVILKIYNYNRD